MDDFTESDTVLTKEEFIYYQNIRKKWHELKSIIGDPPENSNINKVEDENLYHTMSEAKQVFDQIEAFINNKGPLTWFQKWFRTKHLNPYLPEFLSGNLSPFTDSLNRLDVILNDIQNQFHARHKVVNSHGMSSDFEKAFSDNEYNTEEFNIKSENKVNNENKTQLNENNESEIKEKSKI